MEVEIVTTPFEGVYNRWMAHAKMPFKSFAFAARAVHANPSLPRDYVIIHAYGRTKESARARCERRLRDAVEQDRRAHAHDLSKIAQTSIDPVEV